MIDFISGTVVNVLSAFGLLLMIGGACGGLKYLIDDPKYDIRKLWRTLYKVDSNKGADSFPEWERKKR